MRLQEQKKIILEDFNFEKVQKVFRQMGWALHNKKSYPTINELTNIASHCLTKAIKEGYYLDETGFEAWIHTGNEFGKSLELRFIIAIANPLTELLI